LRPCKGSQSNQAQPCSMQRSLHNRDACMRYVVVPHMHACMQTCSPRSWSYLHAHAPNASAASQRPAHQRRPACWQAHAACRRSLALKGAHDCARSARPAMAPRPLRAD
jgi:hypothetical protein